MFLLRSRKLLLTLNVRAFATLFIYFNHIFFLPKIVIILIDNIKTKKEEKERLVIRDLE